MERDPDNPKTTIEQQIGFTIPAIPTCAMVTGIAAKTIEERLFDTVEVSVVG
ncbi:MAG TPA: hypothetical protein VEI99_09170 [Terriglobales bacterium]|nr:hypothetical protein [Terriglobales bacterium]